MLASAARYSPMRWLLVFFVTIGMRVPSDRLTPFLHGLRLDIQQSHQRHPGRLHTRIFQSVEDPGHLLSLGKWGSAADFARFRQQPDVQQYLVHGTPPAQIDSLERLREFARMSREPSVVACAVLRGPDADAVRNAQDLLDRVRRDLESRPGLLRHELYRYHDRPGTLLDVHGWESFEHLDHFRTMAGPSFDAELAARSVTTERFVGTVLAEFVRADNRATKMPR